MTQDWHEFFDSFYAPEAGRQDQAEHGLREQRDTQDDPNTLMSEHLVSILRCVKDNTEGLGEREIKTLCYACGIDYAIL